MLMMHRRLGFSLVVGSIVWALFGCSNEGTAYPINEPNPDAAAGSGGETSDAAAPGTPDAASGNSDGAAPDGSAPASFTVPTAGGNLMVVGLSGQAISFMFPASAAGEDITLTPRSAADIGWPDGTFGDVIEMAPDGLVFDDPVIVRPESGDLLAFTFPTSTTQSSPEPLLLNADGTGLELHHFSTMAFVPPGLSCEGDNGWVVSNESSQCGDAGTNTQFMQFSCNGASFCYQIEASCCAPEGALGCSIDFPNLSLSFTPTGSNGGEYPYCEDVDGGASGDASAAGEPTLVSIEPSSGAPGLTVTVTGENFDSYYATDALHYVAGFAFLDGNGDPVSTEGPTPATQETDLNIIHFDVPTVPVGDYDVRINFRDGTFSANTLPFTVTQ